MGKNRQRVSGKKKRERQKGKRDNEGEGYTLLLSEWTVCSSMAGAEYRGDFMDEQGMV